MKKKVKTKRTHTTRSISHVMHVLPRIDLTCALSRIFDTFAEKRKMSSSTCCLRKRIDLCTCGTRFEMRYLALRIRIRSFTNLH